MAEIPSVPQSAAVSQVERASREGNVTIRLSWMQPQNFDQFDIDRYDINVTSKSGVQIMTTADGGNTSTVIAVSQNGNSVQMNTTYTATIAARSRCNETGPTAAASYILSKFYVILYCPRQAPISVQLHTPKFDSSVVY